MHLPKTTADRRGSVASTAIRLAWEVVRTQLSPTDEPMRKLHSVIPTAMLAGLLLGMFVRWWAVPIVGLGWATAIVVVDPSSLIEGALLGAVNAAVGVLVALAVRRAFETAP